LTSDSWMTFNILVRNYDAHGKNISFFTGKKGLELTPFYDLVNIEAIIREIQSQQTNDSHFPGQEHNISQHFAMSIGDYSTGNSGNFSQIITAYMLADFADEFEISLPRMQLLMDQMIKSVLSAVTTAKHKALEQNLSSTEVRHIHLCIEIIHEAAKELSEEVKQLPSMRELFE